MLGSFMKSIIPVHNNHLKIVWKSARASRNAMISGKTVRVHVVGQETPQAEVT